MALSSQIAALEAENVGTKNWATKGEAKSRDRPVNSLLDEDLEYERMGKVVPVITEESTKTIEDLIKKRILEVGAPSRLSIKYARLSLQSLLLTEPIR